MRKLTALLATLFAGSVQAQATVSDLLATLDSQLAIKRPELVSSLRPPLTAEQIADLEDKHHIILPDIIKTLYKWHDGQDPSDFKVFVNNMQFQPLTDVLETKAELDGMIGYDFELKNWWHPAWLPVFQNGGGDYLVIDMAGIHTGNANQLLTVYHDRGTRPIVAKDLVTFLQAAIDYHDATQIEAMDEFHYISDFLPRLKTSFTASGIAEPLR